MTVFFFVLGAVIVFVIAAVVVGGETFRLGHTPTTTVFDLDEAVDVVAEGLSDETAAGLTLDELRELLRFSLDHFRAKGITALPGEQLHFEDGQTPPVVIADDDAVAVVLGRADAQQMDVTDTAVLEVLDGLLAHLVDIGAVGPVAGGASAAPGDDPELP